MIICNSHKFIVLKSVRTGSSAFNLAIRESGLINPDTDSVSRIKFMNIPSVGIFGNMPFNYYNSYHAEFYDIYGIYRNPVDRFISTCNLIKQNKELYSIFEPALNKNVEDITYEDIIDMQWLLFSLPMFRPQSHILSIPRIQIIDYNNLSESIASIITKYGGTVDIPVVNQSTVRMAGDITPELIAKIEAHYSEDMLIKPNFVA